MESVAAEITSTRNAFVANHEGATYVMLLFAFLCSAQDRSLGAADTIRLKQRLNHDLAVCNRMSGPCLPAGAAPLTGAYLEVNPTYARVVGSLLQSTTNLRERVGRREAALLLLAYVSSQLQPVQNSVHPPKRVSGTASDTVHQNEAGTRSTSAEADR